MVYLFRIIIAVGRLALSPILADDLLRLGGIVLEVYGHNNIIAFRIGRDNDAVGKFPIHISAHNIRDPGIPDRVRIIAQACKIVYGDELRFAAARSRT